MVGSILLLTLLILLSAFFSMYETAIVAVSRFKVRHFVQQKRTGSLHLQKLKDDLHSAINSMLIASNTANIAAASLATEMALRVFGSTGVAIAAGSMTFLILLFGEIVPKSYATSYAGRIALAAAPFVYVFSWLMKPIVFVFDLITRHIFRLDPGTPQITEEEIRNIVDMAREEGGIDKEEKELIHRIFRFDDISVEEIKVPRTDMVTLDSKKTLADAIDLIRRKKHSRLPITEGSKDKVIGIFYIKDALEHIQSKEFSTPVIKLMRDPLFVPESKKIDETLREFQRKNQHMAIIVDEHGGVSGLVTLEDCLEEIVGEIADETEQVDPPIVKLDKRSWKVLGKADMEDVNRKLNARFPVKDDYDTFSGFVLHRARKIPRQGQELKIGMFTLTIDRVERNRVIEVTVKKR